MFRIIIFFGIFGATLATEDSVLCTSDFCKGVTCPELPERCKIQNSTHNGQFLLQPSECNCCPYCLENLWEGEDCSIGDVSTGSPTTICGPGLACTPSNPESTDGTCQRMITTCTQRQDDFDNKKANGTLGTMEVRQECDSEGEFVTYNCIPGQTCYCVNSTGSRIFGEIDYTSKPETQLFCKCSLKHYEATVIMGKQLGPGEYFRCAADGSYETVQCIDDKCFCVDSYDGAPTYPAEKSVNITEVSKDTLKCYKKEEPGIVYPACTEIYLKVAKEYESYKEKGYRAILGYQYPSCDLDGTYKAVQENSTHKFCVDKEGSILYTVDKVVNATLAESMNCKCARANLIMTTFEKATCDENGNYSEKQCRRGKCRCVDYDGNQVCKSTNCEVDENEELKCPTRTQ
ncbi:uncharacterized protein LOC130446258 [Diorhabda sublineata]|uniref:uncharacterized protein LOC130446258 n=1 Tax=Diorhabda sublineata TaxID=1163346 RepID=UPI0024E0D31C|nr:uncharacterized protein LOC130446258 [Diorhabda sublineata]